MDLSRFATDKYRWVALVFIALGLAIVIIDNNVLTVAIPYIIRDLNTTFDGIQWVISGYALIIATLLITVGRLGDIYGRKKIFILGTIFFAIGSFIASIAPDVYWLFIGEALIEAIGAAMMLTSSLSLLTSEFQGKERAIAFGIWGTVAGASASIGPLLGGYLTTYYSWRWSLRINVIVALIAILGSVFVKESFGRGKRGFDWLGTIFSGAGLFCLIFGFIEGRKYGWWAPNEAFQIGNWVWPLTNISIIPYVFGLAAFFLLLFIWTEYLMEKNGRSPLMRLSLFKNVGFSLGLATLGIVVMGQFGSFFVLPIYLQNVLGLDALETGFVFLWASVSILIFGPLSGYIASKIGAKWVVVAGMFASVAGTYMLIQSLSTNATAWSLGPSFIVFGIGVGMASSQLTNIILSSISVQFAGEASAVNATIRQIGTSIGIALIGTILASSTSVYIKDNIKNDTVFPPFLQQKIAEQTNKINAESGRQQMADNKIVQKPLCYPKTQASSAPLDTTVKPQSGSQIAQLQVPKDQLICIKPEVITNAIKSDVNNAIVSASKDALNAGIIFVIIGWVLSFFLPNKKPEHH